MKRLLIGLMVLAFAASAMGQTFFMKSGIANPTIDVFMTKMSDGTTAPITVTIADVHIFWTESGNMTDTTRAAQQTSEAIDTLATETTVWNDYSMIPRPSTGWYRLDLPIVAVDGGIGTDVTIYVTDHVYEGTAVIHLGTPVNAYLSDGSTPPTAPSNFTALDISAGGVVEANVASIDTGIAGADVWNSLWTSYTTQNSFGRLIKQIYDKVMSLR